MTGAHWLILAAATVVAVLCLWWTRRHPRVWRQEEVDEIRRRARERSEQTRQWFDEPGDAAKIRRHVAAQERGGDEHG